jgi:predicted phosphodiesterase
MDNISSSIAVIADIHGNLPALAAVLADIDRRGVSRIFNLGDSLCGSLWPGATARLLQERAIPSLCGNQDRVLCAPPPAFAAGPDFARAQTELSAADWAWLRAQPPLLAESDLLFCHGTPTSDETYLLDAVYPTHVGLRTGEAIDLLLGETQAAVICCGHSHRLGLVQTPRGRLVVNPGSVGIPAYTDDTPWPHAMEAGSPHARYALLTSSVDGWQVDLIALAYHHEEAAGLAERRGRSDRARWIRTGRM